MKPDPIKHFQKISKLLAQAKATNQSGRFLLIPKAFEMAANLILREGKVMIIGNGGSAAIASHLQNDLCKSVGAKAMVFNEPPLLTALSNDHGYECVFERPVQLWAQRGDLLIAISSSGESKNILAAVEAAKKLGCTVISFSGFKSTNSLRRMGNLNFYVDSDSYGDVEVSHMALVHFLTDYAMSVKSKAKKASLS